MPCRTRDYCEGWKHHLCLDLSFCLGSEAVSNPRRSMSTHVIASICLVVLFYQPCYSWNTVINASVLGTPYSNDVKLYSAIADVLFKESSNGTVKRENYCRLNFKEFNFDMSSGEKVFDSLVHARQSFKTKKVAVAIGPFIEVFTSTNYVIMSQTHILTSSPGANNGLMDPSRVMSILPDEKSLAIAIARSVTNLNWKDVAFLTQGDLSPVLSLGRENVSVYPVMLPKSVSSAYDHVNLRKHLLAIQQSDKNNFILHSNDRQLVWNVLETANQLRMLHGKEWFVTFLDFEDLFRLNSNKWEGTLYGFQLLQPDVVPEKVTSLQTKDLVTRELSRFELGLAYDVVALLRDILEEESRDCTREKLTEDYNIPPEAITWQLKNKKGFEGALGLYKWDENNKRTDYTVDVFRYNGALTKVGTATIVNGTVDTLFGDLLEDDTKSTTVFGQNDTVKVATKQTDPFMIKQGDKFTGFGYDLLVLLSEKLNFTFELIEVEDREPSCLDDCEWNGMVIALLEGNVSMAVGALEITAKRENKIAFSHKIQSSEASILIKKAETTTNYFQFLGPFSWDLWTIILLFMIVAGVSLYVMSRFDPLQEGNSKHFDLKESFWYSINIVLQGTTDYSPDTTSMRVIIAFFWFCILIIEAAYTANLAAFLTLQQIDDRITTIQDLADKNTLTYGIKNGSEIMHFFKDKHEDPFVRMWANMALHPKEKLLTNSSDIISRVKAGQLAYIAESVTNEYYANQHCGIESIKQNFGFKDFGIGVPRGAAYLDEVNKALLQLNEAGIVDQLKEKWWKAGRNCTGDDDSRSVNQKMAAELDIDNMFGVFLVLGGFIVISIIAALVECVLKHRDARVKKKKEALELNETKENNVLQNHVDAGYQVYNDESNYGVQRLA